MRSPLFSLALEVMPKARYKKIFLVSELRIQPRLVHTCGPLQVLQCFFPFFQKTGIAFSSTSSWLKFFGRPMQHIVR